MKTVTIGPIYKQDASFRASHFKKQRKASNVLIKREKDLESIFNISVLVFVLKAAQLTTYH